MSISVVWLDSEKAKIFHISEERMQRELLQPGPAPLQERLVEKLSSGSKILILGSEEINLLFFEYLKANHAGLAKKVVACEISSQPTDQEIAHFAMKYFQKPVV